MEKLFKQLEGKKTYIMVGLAALSILGYAGNLYDKEILSMLLNLFGFGALATLRHAVAKK